MKEDAAARIDRLIAWLKNNKPELCTDGEPDAKQLSLIVGGRLSYWYDILRKQNGKSFGRDAAAKTEAALQMSPFYLEGAHVADWPFELIAADEFYSLTPKQQGAVEKAMRDAMNDLLQKQVAGK